MAFFDQKHGLTPLEKSIFCYLKNLCFLKSKQVSFFSAKALSIISSLILTKSKLIKKNSAFFGQKHK